MAELYRICSDQSTAEILTLLLFTLVFLAIAAYKYDIIKTRNLKPTIIDQWTIRLSTGLTVFCGIILFGKFFFAENADNLLALLHLQDFLKSSALIVQNVLLTLISALS